MGLECFEAFSVLLLFCVSSIAAGGFTSDNNELLKRLDATDELVKALANRVDLLESREKIHINRIANLEARDNHQQETIAKLQQQLENQRPLAESDDDVKQHGDDTRQHEEPNSESYSESKHIRRTLSTIKERSVQRIRQAQFESPVAFYVQLHSDFTHAGIHQMFIFQDEITNTGNAYNTVSGMFTAPVGGIYVFSTTLVSLYHVNAHSSFYRNNDQVNIMYVSGGEAGYDTTSATIVLHLQKGDIISVRNGDSDVSYVGRKHSSFSGFLLGDYDSPAVVDLWEACTREKYILTESKILEVRSNPQQNTIDDLQEQLEERRLNAVKRRLAATRE